MKSSPNGITPLMLAASRGDCAAVEDLLARAGEEVNAQDNFGYTALMYAASAGDGPALEALVRAGGDLLMKNCQGLSALDLALAKGHEGAALILRRARLFVAARDGDMDELTNILDQGTDMNARESADGWTALMAAAFHNHPHVVSRLLLRGADPELATASGQTALQIARRQGHAEVVRLLHDYGAAPAPAGV